MRTEQEIKDVKTALEVTGKVAPIVGIGPDTTKNLELMVMVLGWALGEDNKFSDLIKQATGPISQINEGLLAIQKDHPKTQ